MTHPIRRLLLGLVALTVTCSAACTTASGAPAGLDTPVKKDLAMQLVSSAENSSLDWRAQYGYIEDIGDGRGYTAGIIGFCTGCGDLLHVVEAYAKARPATPLKAYLPALRTLAHDNSAGHDGLSGFVAAWRHAGSDPAMRTAQDGERDVNYFDPAVSRAKRDGLGALGQFFYYDAMVMHGNGDTPTSFAGIRERAVRHARTPARGGDEETYLDAYLDARVWAMRAEPDHTNTSRVDTEQRVFLDEGNLTLQTPLTWKVYGDRYHVDG